MSESFSTVPAQTILPAFVYSEYADDENVQGIFGAYNGLAQGYLDWFNNTPLAVYTNPNINGPLLDWIAQGIYGISRPIFSSLSTKYIAGLNSLPLNSRPLNGNLYLQSGTATIADDDYYKRTLTWWLYAGDGRLFNTPILRRKIARFLYGASGADVSMDENLKIQIQAGMLTQPDPATLSSVAGGTIAATTYYVMLTYVTPTGETYASVEASLAVAADYLLVVDSPLPQNGATGYNVYVSTTTGTETKQNSSPIAIGTNWTEPTTGLISGSALPTSNTSNLMANFIITIPAGISSQYFQQAFEQGLLAFPFQLTANVVIS